MKNLFAFDVAEIDVLKFDDTAKAGDLLSILPPPASGLFLHLDGVGVVFAHVHQPDRSFIDLALLVEKVENPLRSRKGHRYAVELVGHLGDGSVDVPAELEEDGDRSEGDRTGSMDCQQASDDGDEDVLDVADIAHHRHENIREAVGIEGGAVELFVQLVEPGLRLFFMGEDLDHLLTVDHLFDESVRFPQRLLLLHEVGTAFTRHHGREPKGDREGEEDDERQLPRREDHRKEDRDDGRRAVYEVRQGLGNHLAEGVDIVGVEAHHIAVGAPVEVGERQTLHVDEHLQADRLERALSDFNHQQVVEQRRDDSDEVDGGHHPDRPQKRGEGGAAALGDHRSDMVIDEDFQKERAGYSGDGAEEDRDHNNDKTDLVRNKDVGEEALERSEIQFYGDSAFGTATAAMHPGTSHARSSFRIWPAYIS